MGAVEVLRRERSAVVGQVTGTETEEVLFPVLGSFVLVAEAEFTRFVEQRFWLFCTCTVIVRMMEIFGARVPMGQETCWPAAVHPAAETKVSPAGSVSVRVTF